MVYLLKNSIPGGGDCFVGCPDMDYIDEGVTMPKTIKLDDQIYQKLEDLRSKRETFSEVVARLINFHREISQAVWSSTGEHPNPPHSILSL